MHAAGVSAAPSATLGLSPGFLRVVDGRWQQDATFGATIHGQFQALWIYMATTSCKQAAGIFSSAGYEVHIKDERVQERHKYDVIIQNISGRLHFFIAPLLMSQVKAVEQ